MGGQFINPISFTGSQFQIQLKNNEFHLVVSSFSSCKLGTEKGYVEWTFATGICGMAEWDCGGRSGGQEGTWTWKIVAFDYVGMASEEEEERRRNQLHSFFQV